jgi:hypothetical protein
MNGLNKGGRIFGQDYFDELLERIREIRTLEKLRGTLLPSS